MFAIFESVLSKPHEAKSLREKLLGKKKNKQFGNVLSKAHEAQALREVRGYPHYCYCYYFYLLSISSTIAVYL